MNTLKPLVLTLALAGLSSGALAKPLAVELEGLVERHPLIQSARKLVDAADSSEDAARAGYLPRVSLYADGGRERIESRSYAPTAVGNELEIRSSNATNPNTKSDLNRSKLGVTVEQNLYSGNRTDNTVGIAKTDVELRQAELRGTTQSILFDGLVAYMQIARLKTLLAVAELNEKTTLRQMGLEDDRMQRGGGIAVDVLQARTRLQIARERKVFIQQSMRDAAAVYQQVFGHAPDLDSIQDVDIIKAQLPGSLQRAIEMALDANSQIRESALQSRRAQKQIGLEKAGFFPSVDLVASYGADKNVNQIERRREASALLRFNWSLYSGNETRSRSDAALKTYEAVVDREAAVVRKVEEGVRTAWNQLENGRERQELLQNAAKIASEVMGFRKKLRDAGKETAINVLDAEVEYYSVLSNMINAEYDSKIAFYRLLFVTGQFTPENIGLAGSFRIPTKPLVAPVRDEGVAAAPATAPAVPATAATAPATAPVAAQQPAAKEPAAAVEAALEQWAKAWSSKDVAAFLAAHSADFAPAGTSRADWEKQRTARLSEARWIKVGLKDVQVEMMDNGRARARFTQAYASDRFRDVTNKTFELVQQDGTWKIAAQQ